MGQGSFRHGQSSSPNLDRHVLLEMRPCSSILLVSAPQETCPRLPLHPWEQRLIEKRAARASGQTPVLPQRPVPQAHAICFSSSTWPSNSLSPWGSFSAFCHPGLASGSPQQGSPSTINLWLAPGWASMAESWADLGEIGVTKSTGGGGVCLSQTQLALLRG